MRYEIRERRINGKVQYAIFDENGNRISEWFDEIYEDGLVLGESEYYLAKKNGKWAIFHKSGKRISDWFDLIVLNGLIKGQSEYFIAVENGKYAIFHKSGEQVGEWFDWVYEKGLVLGENDFFVALKNDQFAVYYKSGEKVIDGGYEPVKVLEERKIDKNYRLLVLELKNWNKTKWLVLLCNNQTCKNLKEFENKPPELNDEFIDKLLSKITLEGKSSKKTIKVEVDVDLSTSNNQSLKRKIKL